MHSTGLTTRAMSIYMRSFGGELRGFCMFQKTATEALVLGSPCALKTWRAPLEFNDHRTLSGHTLSRQDAGHLTGCSTYPHFTEGETKVWALA